MTCSMTSPMLNLPCSVQPYHAMHVHGTILEFLLSLFVVRSLWYGSNYTLK